MIKIIRTPRAVILLSTWSKKGFGVPLVSVFVRGFCYAFAQKDHKGRVVWFERNWSEGYEALTR